MNQGVGQSVGQGPGADYSQLEAALDHGDDYRQLLQCNHPLINLSNDGRVIRLFASKCTVVRVQTVHFENEGQIYDKMTNKN